MRKMCFNILALVMIVSMIIPAPVVFAAPAAAPVSYTVEGTVVDPRGLPFSNVEITWVMDGIAQAPIQTNTNGTYQLTVYEGYSLEIQPEAEGYVFSPGIRTIDAVFENQYLLNFHATGVRSVTGQVSSSYSFCEHNAIITFVPLLVPPDVAFPVTATTSSTDGGYTLSGLEPTQYRVTYERTGCETVEYYVLLSTEPTVVDFINVEPSPATVSGMVKLPNDTALVGATISYSVNGGSSQTTAALSDGRYTLSGVRYGDSVTINPPTIDGYQFSPTSYRLDAIDAVHTDLNFQAAGTRVMSGRIINSFAADSNHYCYANVSMVFAPVNPGQANSQSTTSDIAGFFNISTLEPIPYELQISNPNCRYLNIPLLLPPDANDITNYTIAAWQDKYTISGRVTTGTPAVGVAATVHVTGTAANADPLDFTTTSDANGYYNLENTFNLNDTITVQFISDAYTFSPASIPLGPIQSDFTGQNSVATLNTYTVAGVVRLQDLTTQVEGVTLSFNGQTTTSDSLGRYQFLDVPHGTTSTLTASSPNFSFLPNEILISNLSGNVAETSPNGQFTAIPHANISGKITYKGAPLAGVTVSFNLLTTTTAADGSYQFASIPPGTSGEIIPSKAGYVFNPEKIAALMPALGPLGAVALTGQNFSASKAVSITGKVVAKDGTTPLPGVTFTFGAYSAVSGADGTYTISAIPEGTSDNLVPSLAGYRFVPEKTALQVTKNVSLSAITKGIRVFNLSGQVTGAPDTINEVKISLGNRSTFSAADGSFLLSGIDEGTSGSLIASKLGYHFIPENAPITNLNAEMTALTFAIVPNQYTLSGTVLYKGKPLSGITITLYGSDASTMQVVTGKNGRYAFNSVVYGVTYTLVPTGIGYNYSPFNYTVPVKAANQKRNITATPYMRTIIGFISPAFPNFSGEPVRVYYGSGANDYVLTNNDGSFVTPGLPGNKTVVIRPSSKKYSFMPPNLEFPPTCDCPILSGGFSMYPSATLTGRITVAGKPVSGAQINFIGIYYTKTDSQGKYRLQVPAFPGSLPLEVVHPYFRFPMQFFDTTISTTVNWDTATVMVSGKLLDTNGLGTTGTVRVSATQLTPALPDGSYSLEVHAEENVHLWKLKLMAEVAPGYHTSPSTITLGTRNEATNKNFVVKPNAWSVSGKVTYRGRALAGVTVTDTHSGRRAVTDASGAYRITNLLFNAPILLRATKTGYTFSEPSEFIMGDAKVTGQNISAVR